MGKLCQNNSMFWWSLFCIYCFALFGDEGVGKGLNLAMKGRPYFKEEAIIKTFEMKPTFIPQRPTGYSQTTTSNDSAVEDTHPWFFTKGSCPEGSIPIIRTPYNDGLVGNNAPASDVHMHHPRYPHERGGAEGEEFVRDPTLHEHAMVEFTANKLHGASAKFNVQHPSLEGPHEFSVAQMWIASQDRTTTLEAGWAVYPELYNDYKTRLVTLWTTNSYATICFNLHCPGFVWTNPDIPVDTPLVLLSVYGGLQYDVEIEIFQENNSKNWWLRLRGHMVGYWPKSIVPKLGDGAQIHAFGGEILNKRLSGHHTTTHMGSGRFAEEGFKKAAYIRNVLILEDLHSHYTSPSYNRGTAFITYPNCYDLQLGPHMDAEWGYNFFYGGPGGSATCT